MCICHQLATSFENGFEGGEGGEGGCTQYDWFSRWRFWLCFKASARTNHIAYIFTEDQSKSEVRGL